MHKCQFEPKADNTLRCESCGDRALARFAMRNPGAVTFKGEHPPRKQQRHQPGRFTPRPVQARQAMSLDEKWIMLLNEVEKGTRVAR
jgi:hypothetical protein